MQRLVSILLLLAGWAPGARGQGDGIFADFSTTLGNFTVALDYSNAPRAVASFVGLATGSGSWADPQGNVWQTKFYDGSIFHRVVKDAHTNGVAIQGGGFPTRTVATVDRPVGVSTSLYAAQLTVTNPPGTVTNVLNLPVVTTNAAAVATNYVLNGTTVATTAPMVTLTWIAATVTSSNAPMGTFTNRATKSAGFTNFTLVAHVTTNVCPVAVALTNGSGTIVTTVHAIAVQATASNILRGPTVRTNFADAGYDMLETVTNGLTHSNGVISMANAGPNTDGSQFFITATSVPAWNGSYSVFGHVVTGLDVVASIAAVPVGAGERPLQDIALSNVVIRRVGAAARDFNIASQGVPIAESGPMSATTAGTNLVLRIEKAGQTEARFRESGDLQTWESEVWGGGLYTGATTVVTGFIPRVLLGDRYFFHLSRLFYPVPITSPATHRGRIYTFIWNTEPRVVYEARFASNDVTPGVAFEQVGTNAATSYQLLSGFESWMPSAYSARLVSLDARNYYYYYAMGFNPGAPTNRFTCTRVNGFTQQTFVFSGTFTVQ